jgi:hypothetical protein
MLLLTFLIPLTDGFLGYLNIPDLLSYSVKQSNELKIKLTAKRALTFHSSKDSNYGLLSLVGEYKYFGATYCLHFQANLKKQYVSQDIGNHLSDYNMLL